jgi:hypothetical protein
MPISRAWSPHFTKHAHSLPGGEDCTVRIWSIKTGELLFAQSMADTLFTAFCWPESSHDLCSSSLFDLNHSWGAWLGSRAGLFYMHGTWVILHLYYYTTNLEPWRLERKMVAVFSKNMRPLSILVLLELWTERRTPSLEVKHFLGYPVLIGIRHVFLSDRWITCLLGTEFSFP